MTVPLDGQGHPPLLGPRQPSNLLHDSESLEAGRGLCDIVTVCKAAVSPEPQGSTRWAPETRKPVAGMFTQPQGRPLQGASEAAVMPHHNQGHEP